MLTILYPILLFSPLIFQLTYGTKAIYKNTSMSFGKISLITFVSQIVISIALYSFSLYNFSKYFDEHPDKLRCGTPLAGILICLLFLIAVLTALIVLQFIIIIWKKNRMKSDIA